MGLFKSIASIAASPIAGLSSAFGLGQTDSSTQNALLSGIPFIGQGFAQNNAQNFNASEAEKQRAWQSHMSNTQHQRQIKDLKAAGLNPILSANTGASVGGGASASVNPMSGAGDSKDMLMSMYKKENKKATAEINLNKQMKQTQKANEAHHMNSAKKAATEDRIQKENLKLIQEKNKKDLEYQKTRNPQIEYYQDRIQPAVTSALGFGAGAKLLNKFLNSSGMPDVRGGLKKKGQFNGGRKKYRNDKNAPF